MSEIAGFDHENAGVIDQENSNPNVIGNAEDMTLDGPTKQDKKRKITRQQKRNNPFLGAMMIENALQDTHLVIGDDKMKLC